MTESEAVRHLLDRAETTDVVTRFAVALDTRDWTLWRSCLADRNHLRRSDGWRIVRSEQVVSWNEGNGQGVRRGRARPRPATAHRAARR
jgi:hypothetical protein